MKPLVSISHPRKDGGTAQLNTFSAANTQLTLTDTNLETARQQLARQLDDRGKPTRVGGGKLILLVPTELEKTAVILTKGEKRSGTANNDVNIYDGIMTVKNNLLEAGMAVIKSLLIYGERWKVHQDKLASL